MEMLHFSSVPAEPEQQHRSERGRGEQHEESRRSERGFSQGPHELKKLRTDEEGNWEHASSHSGGETNGNWRERQDELGTKSQGDSTSGELTPGCGCECSDASMDDESESESQADSNSEQDLEGIVICSRDMRNRPPCQCPTCRNAETVEQSYWDNLYWLNYRKDTFSEYLISYHTLEPILKVIFLSRTWCHTQPVLVPGCGDSPFAVQLAQGCGFSSAIASDISEVAVDVLVERGGFPPGFKVLQDDMTQSSLQSNSLGVIVDKSLIDCMFWCDDEDTDPVHLVSRVLEEYHRTLVPGGVAIIVTTTEPDMMLPLVHQTKESKSSQTWFASMLELWVEADEGGEVPTNATIQVAEPGGRIQAEFAKTFFMYVLDKSWSNEVKLALDEIVQQIEVYSQHPQTL